MNLYSSLTSPGGLLVRPVVVEAVVALALEPLHLLLLAHLVVRHLRDRELGRVRRQLGERTVERQPEGLAQAAAELDIGIGVHITILG